MTDLTLDDARTYLRVSSHDEDALIEEILRSAEQLVSDVCRTDLGQAEDDNSPLIRVAVLYALAYLYEHREEADHTDLTLTLRSLLFGVRKEVF